MLNVAKHLFLARLIINNDCAGEERYEAAARARWYEGLVIERPGPPSVLTGRGWALGIISLWFMNLWQFVYKSDDLFELFFSTGWTH